MTEAATAANVREALTTVGTPDVTKRDFLKLLTGSAAVIGTAALVWPFIDSMNPARDTLALSSIDVDLNPVGEGQAIAVVCGDKPVFLRNRTAEEIKEAQDTPLSQLKDPQKYSD